MTERLFQFIWQFQYFNKKELQTTCGQEITIIHPGQLNRHQGPDFLEGRIRIGSTLWIGNIELHLRAGDWQRHAHHRDSNYENVVLHVVWEDDANFALPGIPTLVLGGRISRFLLQQYTAWMQKGSFIPCSAHAGLVEDIIWISWKERLVAERLLRKVALVNICLEQNNGHWEETLWWMLARSFGLPVNAEAFEELARTMPYYLLMRHRKSIHILESLLMGQAGLLEGRFIEQYPQMLQREYKFFRAKYALSPIQIPVHYLRMRPAGFPALRLAQLAMVLQSGHRLLTEILTATEPAAIIKLLTVTANDYWHYHFRFDDAGGYKPKRIGAQMVNSILINTIVPILFAHGCFHHNDAQKSRAMEWLLAIPAEKNSVTASFSRYGVANQCASDSQALLELKGQYCDSRRCLDCSIGNAILKRNQS